MPRPLEIVFTDTVGIPNEYAPVPCEKALPAWFKETASNTEGTKSRVLDANTSHTIKKCVPVFDALTSGYLISTYVDIDVQQRDGLPFYQWPQLDAISFHPISQAPQHPALNGAPYPKWRIPWAIKTPPGVSCLILPPMHNPNGMFTILPGVVDTDTYCAPVNFPFTLDEVTWEGLIPAGTPMAQVIPFRRDAFKMRIGSERDVKEQDGASRRLRSLWFNSYKRQFWARKQWQ